VRKRKFAAVGMAVAPRKISRKWGRGRRLTRSEAQTSAQELAFVPPLKHSVKFGAKSSGLSPTQKASLAAGKKTFSSSMGRSSAVRALKRVLNFFGSDSSASDEEAAPSKRPQKRSKESSILKDIPKSSPAKGMFELFVFLSSCAENYEDPSCFAFT
jgi:hypothetical protein